MTGLAGQAGICAGPRVLPGRAILLRLDTISGITPSAKFTSGTKGTFSNIFRTKIRIRIREEFAFRARIGTRCAQATPMAVGTFLATTLIIG